MSKRLKILESSLEKKQKELDRRFDVHFATVKQANGQPLNDKRNGRATLNKWERQSDAIRNQKREIEKTEDAIEKEKAMIDDVMYWRNKMPKYVTDLIDAGKIKQWRKHPRFLFVEGVEKARLVFSGEDGLMRYRHLRLIPNKEQFFIFKDIFNGIKKEERKCKTSE